MKFDYLAKDTIDFSTCCKITECNKKNIRFHHIMQIKAYAGRNNVFTFLLEKLTATQNPKT